MSIVLSPVAERYVLHWGEMGSRWGVNRSVAQIHALLFLSERPLNADEIAETLNIARSNVSTSIKELLSWRLISVVHVMGDRRDYFEAQSDTWDLFFTIVEERKQREIDPTIEVLRKLMAMAEDDGETPQAVKKKLSAMLEMMETMSGWYEQVRKLPRASLIRLMNMGTGVVGLLKS